MQRRAVLVVGHSGQLALALSRLSGKGGIDYTCIGRPELDLGNPDTIDRAIVQVGPQAVINAAAYTAVDKAEDETELAFAINAQGPEVLARACARCNLPLVHVSTDYVFDGSAKRPYRSDDTVRPIGVYGKSKAAGEDAIRETLARHLIVRTSWLFSADGHNFLKTMLRLGEEKVSLSVVYDQTGSPTYAADLAQGLHYIIGNVLESADFDHWGTYHMTNSGITSWHGFASEIFRQAAQYGYQPPDLISIPSSSFPTVADRPVYSVLDNERLVSVFGIEPPDWRDAVGRCLEKYFAEREAT